MAIPIKKATGSPPAGVRRISLAQRSGSPANGIRQVGVAAASQVSSGPAFTLASAAKTSVGIFKLDGTLLKQLWNNVASPAGTTNVSWDGLDQDGNVMPAGSYQVGAVPHNLSYEWLGVAGNTSSLKTGEEVIRGMYPIHCICASSGNLYFGNWYNEGNPASNRMTQADITKRYYIGVDVPRATALNIFHVCTDGTKVYWAGTDGLRSATTPSFVWASNVSNNAQSTFSSGVQRITNQGAVHTSAIDYVEGASSEPTGMDVQRSGSYLFVSHGLMNELHVLNRSTGALVQTLTYTNPRGLAIDSLNDNALWMISGTNTIAKYTINSNGTLTTATASITGTTTPLAIASEPTTGRIAIADGGNQQIVKFYNTSGTLVETLGQTGGYATTSIVSNDRFMFKFNDRAEGTPIPQRFYTYLAYQPNGSLWIGDPGNYRSQRFERISGAWSYKDNIQYLPVIRSCWISPTAPTRLYVDYCELEIDYSKPLEAGNDSWKLIRNYAYGLNPNWDDENQRLRYVHTYPNGRTYGVIKKSAVYRDYSPVLALVELTATGLRVTGQEIPSNSACIDVDGSIIRRQEFGSQLVIGQIPKWYRTPVTGTDGNNNPIYGPEVQIAQTSAFTADDPISRNYGAIKTYPLTSSGVMLSAEIGYGVVRSEEQSTKYHIGGVKNGKWMFRGAKQTPNGYTGPYPMDGSYDNQNQVHGVGGFACTIERSIFWNHIGEFWKGGQTNQWQHVHDSGLHLVTFGTNQNAYVDPTQSKLEMSGNSITGNIVKVGANYYLWHCDESHHGGIHCWKISKISTIQEQYTTFVKA